MKTWIVAEATNRKLYKDGPKVMDADAFLCPTKKACLKKLREAVTDAVVLDFCGQHEAVVPSAVREAVEKVLSLPTPIRHEVRRYRYSSCDFEAVWTVAPHETRRWKHDIRRTERRAEARAQAAHPHGAQ